MQVGLHTAPTFKPDALATHPAVAFDAFKRQTLVLNTPGHALGQSAPGFTAAFVVRASLVYGPPPDPEVEWKPNRYLFISHLSDYSTRFAILVEGGTGHLRVSSRMRPNEALISVPSRADEHPPALRGNTWQRLLVSVDYRQKSVRGLLDGVSFFGRLPQASEDTAEDVPSPIIGIASNTLGEWLTCDLAELACYERGLSGEEMRRLDSYFRAKYAIPK